MRSQSKYRNATQSEEKEGSWHWEKIWRREVYQNTTINAPSNILQKFFYFQVIVKSIKEADDNIKSKTKALMGFFQVHQSVDSNREGSNKGTNSKPGRRAKSQYFGKYI